jgi:hypothetical protein
LTLLDVLNKNGGGLDALGRHAVAALLNATSPHVDYPYTQAQVIQMFQDVYPGSKADYEEQKDILAAANERNCDIPKTNAAPTGTAAAAVANPIGLPNTGGPTDGEGALPYLLLLGLAAITMGAWWAARASRRS